MRVRPAILHTHLVHADAYGLLAGTVARVPLRFSTKHGFNEFREAPYFGLADRAFASLAHVHIAISRGLARYLEDVEGFDDDELRDRPLRHRPERRAEAVRGRRAAAALRRPPDPDQGPHRPAAGVRRGEAGVAGPRARDRRPRPARAGAEGARARARHRRRRPLPRHVSPIQAAIERAAVVVVPSMGEGFGMVALEAMERSRPVIAAAIGGLGELVRDGETGLLVAAGEAEPLRDAILDSPATSSSRARWVKPGGGARSRGSFRPSAPSARSSCTRARSSAPREDS